AKILPVREKRVQRSQLRIVWSAVARDDVGGESNLRSQRRAPEPIARLGSYAPCLRAVTCKCAKLERRLGVPMPGAVVSEESGSKGVCQLPASALVENSVSVSQADIVDIEARQMLRVEP